MLAPYGGSVGDASTTTVFILLFLVPKLRCLQKKTFPPPPPFLFSYTCALRRCLHFQLCFFFFFTEVAKQARLRFILRTFFIYFFFVLIISVDASRGAPGWSKKATYCAMCLIMGDILWINHCIECFPISVCTSSKIRPFFHILSIQCELKVYESHFYFHFFCFASSTYVTQSQKKLFFSPQQIFDDSKGYHFR